MISNRRGAAASRTVERLREFAINTSRGVDISQPPVNSTTAAYVKNLIVNPDGSLSLRKPLKHIRSVGNGYRCHTLFDGNVMLYKTQEDGFVEIAIFDATLSNRIPVQVYISDTPGKVYPNKFKDGEVHESASVLNNLLIANAEDVVFINLNNASLIANADVSIAYDDGVVDKSLLDESVQQVPRYLRIEKSTVTVSRWESFEDGNSIAAGWYLYDVDGYRMTVLLPEITELKMTDSGDPSLDPNLIADNPYALTDSYNSTAVAVKGIVGYVMSDIVKNIPVALPTASIDKSTVFTYRVPTVNLEIELVDGKRYDVDESIYLGIGIDVTFKVGVVVTCTDGTAYLTFELDWDVEKLAHSPATEFSSSVPSSLKGSIQRKGESNGYSLGILLSESESGYTSTEPYRVYYPLGDKLDLEITMRDQCYVTYSAPVDAPETAPSKVSELTKSAKVKRYRPVVTYGAPQENSYWFFLKAFGNLPRENASYWASWYYSYDGVLWIPAYTHTPTTFGSSVKVIKQSKDAEDSSKTRVPSAFYVYWAPSDTDDSLRFDGNICINRPDILPAKDVHCMYMFRVVTALTDASGNLVLDDDGHLTEDLVISEVTINPVAGDVMEIAHIDFANAVYGTKLYHKKRIFSYGHEKFFNNIFVSGIDNFNTPLYNVIDLDAKVSDKVSVLVPWRDYLVSATPNAMYIHTPQDFGYLTKTVTTSLGVPVKDAKCCVPILNGILVKSGSKVYLVYPNAYSGTDSVLNLSPISQPVDEYLQAFEENDCECKRCFAFSTESEYVLMLAVENSTSCLRYTYTTRVWTMCEYPVRLIDYDIYSVEDIRLYSLGTSDTGDYTEYQFDANLEEFADQVSASKTIPIAFEWDSGQKTDNISTRKQFTESKIVFATQDEAEDFPMSLIVAVDGDPHVTRIDVRSDAPLQKTEGSVGVLGTNARLNEGSGDLGSATKGLIRQLVVRYSGKGRSVRHILTGTARSPFRMYETYVRYKLVDNKR